jgi:hypothetical protein
VQKSDAVHSNSLGSQDGTSGISGFAGDPAATRAMESLSAGKWRKARDQAKELCKKDRSRYLPLLIEANVGLARDMIARKLLSDAKSVVDYLKTIAPPAVVGPIEAALSEPCAPSKESAGGHPGAKLANIWQELIRQAELVESGASASEAFALADEAVAAFSPELPEPDGPVSTRVAGELAAIYEACEASAEGRWEDASSALRKIPSRSIFRYWRIFLRGMRFHFQGLESEASTCFARLPQGSATALAADVMTVHPSVSTVRPAARAAWLAAISGGDPAWGAAISAADTEWAKGNWLAAWEALSSKLGTKFLAAETGLPAALAEGMLSFSAEEGDVPLIENATRFVAKHLGPRRTNQIIVHQLLKALLLVDWRDMEPSDLRAEWGEVLRLETLQYGPDSLRDSQGWLWLGRKLLHMARELRDPFLDDEDYQSGKSAAMAIDAFMLATQSDPENENAWLGLLAAYELAQNTGMRNRLLDDLVARFPQNKLIVLRAAQLAEDRKALGKAEKYYERVLALDPLDRQARRAQSGILFHRIQAASQKGRPTKHLWERVEALADTTPGKSDLHLSKWILRLKRAIVEPQNEEQLIAEAKSLAPSEVEFLALESLLRCQDHADSRKGWNQEWKSCALSWSSFSHVIFFGSPDFGLIDAHSHACAEKLLEMSESLVHQAQSSDLYSSNMQGLLHAYNALIALEDFEHNLTLEMGSLSVTEKFLKPFLKASSGTDPYLRLFHCAALWVSGSRMDFKKQAANMRELAGEAAASQLQELERAAARLAEDLEEEAEDCDGDWDSEFLDRHIDKSVRRVIADARRKLREQQSRQAKKTASKKRSPDAVRGSFEQTELPF